MGGGNRLWRNEDLPCLPTKCRFEHTGLSALRAPVYPSDHLGELDGDSAVCVDGSPAAGNGQVKMAPAGKRSASSEA